MEVKTVEKVASNIATILESANLDIPIGPNLAFIRSCFTEILTKKWQVLWSSAFRGIWDDLCQSITDSNTVAICNLASMITVAKNISHCWCRVKKSRVSAEPLPQQRRQLQRRAHSRRILVFHTGVQATEVYTHKGLFNENLIVTAFKMIAI